MRKVNIAHGEIVRILARRPHHFPSAGKILKLDSSNASVIIHSTSPNFMPSERAKSALIAVPSSTENDAGEACSICFGSGMEIVPGKGARACSCQRQKTTGSTFDKAKLPGRYNQCHFNNYTTSDPSQVKALRLATQFAM